MIVAAVEISAREFPECPRPIGKGHHQQHAGRPRNRPCPAPPRPGKWYGYPFTPGVRPPDKDLR
jgi:hypothetical protein